MEFVFERGNSKLVFRVAGQTGYLEEYGRATANEEWRFYGTLAAQWDSSGDPMTIFGEFRLPYEDKWHEFLEDIKRQISAAKEAS